ncbi:hypothetical protein [Legionella bononiensis]|uniref:Transmembrane protein n=1 Tax=Legionella bononiensis TaxID=2793102 RepID=A0ABS1WFX0_9GAMM|nr:hypothetical protein [Legionella bononiensis]MBL7481704.1 hypothetical protein [Legionella bononiensis]MBL7528252.1 hypothetical protein [Legionella bononiensis]MBL7562727.1 hypothetical protein [Legionella bononiensis]
MTFMDFATGVFYLPARIFSGMTNLLLGSTYIDDEGEEAKRPGLFSVIIDAFKMVGNFIFDATKAVARGVSAFISNHQKAIAVAFWASLATAGLAVLSVAFWPAALSAVANFAIGGVSIASLVGTGFAAQLSAIGGVAAVATSAVVYVGAAIINTITGIRDFFVKPRGPRGPGDDSAYQGLSDLDSKRTSGSQFSSLLSTQPEPNSSLLTVQPTDEEPIFTKSVFTAAASTVQPTDQLTVTDEDKDGLAPSNLTRC